MPDPATLATVASIIAGFGAAMLAFRIEREASGLEQGQSPWIPWADGLLLSAIFASLLLVVLPIVAFHSSEGILASVPRAACAATCILSSGYIVAILAHYRLILGYRRYGERENPEPAERWVVIGTGLVSLAVFGAVLAHA